MSYRCSKNTHAWSNKADAEKCCHPHWRRTLVSQDGENQQVCAGVSLGRRWIFVGPEAEAPLEAHWILKDNEYIFVPAFVDEGPPEDEETFYCQDCNEIVEKDDPYIATPCGTFCSGCMPNHAKECSVCRSEFEIPIEEDEPESPVNALAIIAILTLVLTCLFA